MADKNGMRCHAIAGILLATTAAAVAAPLYRVTDLHSTSAFWLTSNGTVITTNIQPGAGGGTSYSTIRNGHWGLLGLPKGASLLDVSDDGVLLARVGNQNLVQFPNGTRRTLKPAAGATKSIPLFVNDNGVAAGVAEYSTGTSMAIWKSSAATLSHTPVSAMMAFGSTGTAVLQIPHKTGQSPALAKDGLVTPLAGPTNLASFGNAINDHNTVAGYMADTKHGTSYGVIWSGKSMQKIAPLPGGQDVDLFGLNNNGVAVGYSTGHGLNAVVWDGKTLVDLNTRVSSISGTTSGVDLIAAWDVNDAGQILVQGTASYGTTFFLLTPTATAPTASSSARLANEVPEPTTMLAMTATVGAMVRRRSRRI